MARARNIKPGFFTNDLLAETGPEGMILFAGLWTMADRKGRMEDRPRRIKAEVLPYFDVDVDALLSALAARGFIARYAVNGTNYLQIVNFTKHQNPHVNERDSSIPAPEEHGASTVQAPEEHQSTRAESITNTGIHNDNPPIVPPVGGENVIDLRARRTKPRASPDMGAFDAFWALYPRKVGKKGAMVRWQRIVASGVTPKTIMDGLDLWLPEFAAREAKYVPHPTTWLHGAGWEDEPPVPMRPKNGHAKNAEGGHDEVAAW